MNDSLATLTAQMAAAGIRRMLVLSGDETWSSQQARQLANALPGDWLWVGTAPEMALNGARTRYQYAARARIPACGL
ncbi:Predicted P-loop ATPase fused to an acetyltransferase COG1444 [Cronobacter sakazakii 696]|nr:Predicted P-loop ATPase fused to an acetyltransferase COG1444 [Cronobacter sakazakii 696]